MNSEQKQKLKLANQRLTTALNNLNSIINDKTLNNLQQNESKNQNQDIIEKVKKENNELLEKIKNLSNNNDNIKSNSKSVIENIKRELNKIKIIVK
jgi:hypothetical protein